MNPYHDLVQTYARLAAEGYAYPLGGYPRCPRPDLPPDAPRVLLFAPHPDDEVIIGGYALRLLRESRWRVINVAVTLGSKPERKPGRWEELRGCCQCIGFDLTLSAPGGLDRVTAEARDQEPAHWAACVEVARKIIEREQPRVILCPHAEDWHPTHIGTYWLVADALKALPLDFGCHVVETEFWGQMKQPNLMVELSPQHLGDLMTALTYHVEEVRRNPYHLRLPAWMVDNVRRGAELVGGQGGAAPRFTYATLYRLRRWQAGAWDETLAGGRFLPLDAPAHSLLG